MDKKGLTRGIAVGAIILAGAITLASCITKVPAGYVAVQYSVSGGVKDKVLTQGWHLTPPTIKTTLYTVGIEQSYLTSGNKGDSPDDESFTASSREGKALGIDLTFTYQFNGENVTQVFNQFKGQDGRTVRDSFIKPNITSWTKEVLSKYAVSDILGEKKSEVNAALTEYLSSKFSPYGITISNVSLINITVDQETQDSINAKITAQQNAETQAINNQTAIDKAEADAKVKKTQAQAEADARLIEAEAVAKANEMINESLSDLVLKSEYIEKWNGELPTYVGGGSDNLLIDMGSLETEAE